MFRKYAVYITLLTCLCACTPDALHEAQYTVSQADSLWTAGQSYNDSLALAKAYRTLGYYRWFYPDNYVHACYHYGRLLRQKDDPATAMQTLINATHTRSHDYRILGRVYSNMGSICHLANEFPLSYDMYERSADMFLRNGDTLNYYYALNDMAFELAEQGKKEECLALVSQIEDDSPYTEPQSETYRTKAILYRNTGQYDSALYALNELQEVRPFYPTEHVLKAQAFWYSGQKDSALYYAQYTMSLPCISNQDKHNMLYILLNEDTTLQAEEIKALSEQRADLEMQELVPQHKKNAIAANLLQQDLSKKPRYIYVIVFSVLILMFVLGFTFYGKKNRHDKTKQQEILHNIQQQQSSHYQYKQQEIERACLAIRKEKDWKEEIGWKDYDRLCEYMDKHFCFFIQKLKETQNLKEKDIRLCILVLIGGFSDKQMADILYYGEKSIRGIKRYTAQKLGTSSANFRVFLLDLLTGKSVQ